MKKLFLILTAVLIPSLLLGTAARLKDIATFRGARDNQLFGIGLVVGLNGTGDTSKINSTLLANMISHFGVNIDPQQLKTKNAAIVIVLADIPPFYKEGMRLDVTVASIGDAKSLVGGYLVQTPLYGADGNVYAVAQGPVTVGGEDVKGSTNFQKRYKVVGYIPRGAIVEGEIPSSIVDENSVTIILNSPDITTAARAANAINVKFGSNIAKAIDPSAIKVRIPETFKEDVITFLSLLEEIEVVPDVAAKVVINEKTGTVVFGGNVKISDFTLSYGNFNITIKSGKIQGKEEAEATIGNLVAALKALGATPQDIIAILQVLHDAGVLHAQLVVM